MNNATAYTVYVNGELDFSGSFEEASEAYASTLRWLGSPGEVVSLRDADDCSVKKATVDDLGEVRHWFRG